VAAESGPLSKRIRTALNPDPGAPRCSAGLGGLVDLAACRSGLAATPCWWPARDGVTGTKLELSSGHGRHMDPWASDLVAMCRENAVDHSWRRASLLSRLLAHPSSARGH